MISVELGTEENYETCGPFQSLLSAFPPCSRRAGLRPILPPADHHIPTFGPLHPLSSCVNYSSSPSLMGQLLHRSGLSSAAQPKALAPVVLCIALCFPKLASLFLRWLISCPSPSLWTVNSNGAKAFSDVFLQLLPQYLLHPWLSEFFVEWLKSLQKFQLVSNTKWKGVTLWRM